jgi:hypothetical protein
MSVSSARPSPEKGISDGFSPNDWRRFFLTPALQVPIESVAQTTIATCG